MKKPPVSYLQTDPRWGWLDYSAKGEKTTIRASGCGPTAMAMVLATWAAPSVDPRTECAWALANGYKAPHQGTYYGYFEPAGARYGLEVDRLNWTNIYGRATSPHHETVKEAIERGDLVIACMGKGNWTSSGHYVLVWDIRGETIYIKRYYLHEVVDQDGNVIFKKRTELAPDRPAQDARDTVANSVQTGDAATFKTGATAEAARLPGDAESPSKTSIPGNEGESNGKLSTKGHH